MPNGLRSLWCGLLLVACCAGSAFAGQGEDVYGRVVAGVVFDVEGKPEPSAALPPLVDVQAGRVLTREAVRASLDHLMAIGRYEDVRPSGTILPDGRVEVTFSLTPRHTINRLEVQGETGLAASALRSRILEHYGGIPAVPRTSDVEQATRQILNDEGYLDATVVASIVIQHDPEGATLVVASVAGPAVRIVETVVDGSSPYSHAEVIRRTQTSQGAPFRRRQIDAAISALEDDLRARGYYEAEVVPVPTRAADGIRLRLIVNTGPIVDLRVQPAGALPGSLDELIPVKREHSVDTDLLEDSKVAIERRLRNEGYADARASFARMPSPDGGRLTVTFTIERGQRYFIDRVELAEMLALPPATLAQLIRLVHGDVFSQERLDLAMALVKDEYRRRGYYQVQATPTRERTATSATDVWVVLHPNINEGPRGEVTSATFTFVGQHLVSEDELRSAMQSAPGQPYVEAVAASDKASLRAYYLARGFLNAGVDVVPRVSPDGRSVSLAVSVNEGPQIRIGEIRISGNEHVSDRSIRDELGLAEGQPLSDESLRRAQQRLYEMGTFRRVTVTPAERLSGETEALVVVAVVEARTTTAGIGGGVEARRLSTPASDSHLEFAPSGSFDIGRQNIGGRNRSINLFTRVRLKFADKTATVNDFGFTEYRSTLTYRERRVFNSNSDFLAAVSFEQARRDFFNFSRRAANAELVHRLTNRLSVSGRYVLDFTRVFDDSIPEEQRPAVDRAFPRLRLSTVATGVAWDRRDNPLTPTRGTFVTADLSVAARALASEVGYVKSYLQGSAFRSLQQSNKTVLALRAQVGVARGFSRFVTPVDVNNDPVVGPDGQPIVIETRDLPVSQRFFAGGSTTVRGFQLDRLGIPGETLNPDGFPLGGNGVIVLNAELRRTIAKLFGQDFGVVGFIDGGNVFARASDLDVGRIRGTVGFGARWLSPLGPLRLDFGFKTRRAATTGGREAGWEYHLNIGEAF